MTPDREQTRRDVEPLRDALRRRPVTAGGAVFPPIKRTELDALLAELEQAEREGAALVEALRTMADRKVPTTFGGGTHAFVAFARATLTVWEQE